MNLRIPGPTPCPPEVLAALGKEMVDHRGPEFGSALRRVAQGLKDGFHTANDVLIFTASGTGGLEVAVCNTLSPGDQVLAVSIGNFGDRFAAIAKAYGASVTKLEVAAGQAADLAAIDEALGRNPAIKAVLVTHNETSTGVTNPLQQIAEVVRRHNTLILVDAVSSMSSIPCEVDAWDLDVVVSGSQKGWMVPPGLAFASFSPRAWKANESAKMPRFYFDARKAKESQDKNQTPWTPAVSIVFGLEVALDLLEREGWANVYARHQRVADVARNGAQRLGLKLLADPRYASNTVTAVWAPDGVNVSDLRKVLREQYGTVVGGGQGALTGKIFRIGHLGLVHEADVRAAIDALEAALPKVGYAPAVAAGD